MSLSSSTHEMMGDWPLEMYVTGIVRGGSNSGAVGGSIGSGVEGAADLLRL